VAWSTAADDYDVRIVAPTAAILGLTVDGEAVNAKMHVKHGAPNATEDEIFAEQRRVYEEVMIAHSPNFDPALSMLREAVWNQTDPLLEPGSGVPGH